ncbi:MAG: DUF2283 domain-containing protein [Cyanobacteria bacterium J06628_6]
MDLSQASINNCLQLARVLQGIEQKPFWMSYEAEADVMYLNFSSPPQSATNTEVTDDDIAVRYDSGKIVGITVTVVSGR